MVSVTIRVGGTPNGNTYLARTYPDGDLKAYEVPVYTIKVVGSNGIEHSTSWNALRFMPYLNGAKGAHGYQTVTTLPIMSGLAEPRNAPCPNFKPTYGTQNRVSLPADAGAIVISGTHYIHNGPSSLVGNPGWGGAGCIEVVGFASLKSAIAEFSGQLTTSADSTIGELVRRRLLIVKLDHAARPGVKIATLPSSISPNAFRP